MKKLTKLFVIVLVTIGVMCTITGCSKSESNISEFYVSKGDGINGASYTVTREDGEIILKKHKEELSATGGTSDDEEKIEEKDLLELEKIIKKYDSDKWNGDNDYTELEGGQSFYLTIKYKDGTEINVKNTNSIKDEYKDFFSDVKKIFN